MNLTFEKSTSKKQPIVAILLVIVAIILVWQLYELFIGNKAVHTAGMPSSTAAGQQAGMTVTPTATATQLAQNAATDTDGSATVNPATTSQAEYLRLVNEYQMAQLQRMIAEDNEAIAIAKQNAAKAMSETSKLMGGSNLTVPTDSSQTNPNEYQLVYTGQQSDNSWSATLKKNGQSYDVVVGTKLADGSHVLSIDDNGVLLQQGDVKKLVTFSGVTETAAAGEANNTTTTSEASANNEINNLPKLAQAKITSPADDIINTTAPDKKKREQVSQPKTIPIEHKPVDKKVASEKSEAALTATPDNPTAPAKNKIATSSKAVVDNTKKKAVKDNIKTDKEIALPANSKSMSAEQPTIIKSADLQMPGSKHTQSLLPLQQPMVAFPHAATNKQTAVNKTAPAVVSAPVAANITQAANEANNQILAVNPNYYTIQLTSDHKLENLQQFVNKHDLQNKANYFRTYDMQERELYILIYGQYTTSAEAKAALEKLSAAAKGEGAFVVKYSTIQTVLKKPAPASK